MTNYLEEKIEYYDQKYRVDRYVKFIIKNDQLEKKFLRIDPN